MAKKLQGGGQSRQLAVVLRPDAAPLPPRLPPRQADDAGAAGPDEAISDAADEPHPATTPDDPAEVVDLETPVEDAPKKK